jgi:hypothetical protein
VLWLGETRGFLSDWVTQLWVRVGGRRVFLKDNPWLVGPIGGTRIIGEDFFLQYAHGNNLEVLAGSDAGLLQSMDDLATPISGLANLSPAVRHFYEHTSAYELDAWSEWCGIFRPFGQALAIIFSRRLQQLNVPLSSLDSAKGMSSEVLPMLDRSSHQIRQTAWVRRLRATGNILYPGCYSVSNVPGQSAPCVKVVFPLPNGNAIVLMKTEFREDGSLNLMSAGRAFGDPGFYFTLRNGEDALYAHYVPSMKESIHVYPAEIDTVRADHTLWFWGMRFLRLHYRMRSL